MIMKQSDKPKKPFYKKWWFWVIIVIILAAIGSSTSNKDKEEDKPSSNVVETLPTLEPTAEATATPEPTDSFSSMISSDAMSKSMAIESGRYSLSESGLEFNFRPSVRNDVTGNWRLAITSDSIAPAECAIEYYETMFNSDDEIHGIWNATLGTMTQISAGTGMLFVNTYEYVEGEEHDAKLMFSGTKLTSEVYDLSTGLPLED